MIDLKPFCSTDRFRPNLHNPFSLGSWTYATNGHVCVRVPRRDDVPEATDKPVAANTLFERRNFSDAILRPLGEFDLPTLERWPCSRCEGRGHKHDCPDCNCECENCDGRGETEEDASVGVGGRFYTARYLRAVSALPELQIETNPPGNDPLFFRFAEGGEGLWMPLRDRCEKHAEEQV